jgi:hypothetical protein
MRVSFSEPSSSFAWRSRSFAAQKIQGVSALQNLLLLLPKVRAAKPRRGFMCCVKNARRANT